MNNNEKSKVVIIGGGYAGLQTALHINRDEYQVTLIDKKAKHELLPEIPHRLATPSTTTAIEFADLLHGKNIEFIQGNIEDINYQTKSLQILNNENNNSVKFDILVLALGAQTNYFGIEGLEENALAFWADKDVDIVLNRLETKFQEAINLDKNSDEYKSKLSFVIGGGGLTGIEVATELIYVVSNLCAKYNIPEQDCNLYLVEGMETLLPAVSRENHSLSADITKFFTQCNQIETVLGEFITKVTDKEISLKSGRIISAETIIWTGGIRGNDLFDKSYIDMNGQEQQWTLERGFRLVVNENYQVQGAISHTYAIGDNANAINPVNKLPHVQNGQIAYKQGQDLAKYLNHLLIYPDNIPAYKPMNIKNQGVLVSLGPNIGTGVTYDPVQFKLPINWFSRLLKKIIELRYKIFDIR